MESMAASAFLVSILLLLPWIQFILINKAESFMQSLDQKLASIEDHIKQFQDGQ